MTSTSGSSNSDIHPGQIAREQLAILAGTLTASCPLEHRVAVATLAAQIETADRLKGIEDSVDGLDRTLTGIAAHGLTVTGI